MSRLSSRHVLLACCLFVVILLGGSGALAQSRFAVVAFGGTSLFEIDVQGRPLRTIAVLPSMNVYQVLHANDDVNFLVLGQALATPQTWQILRVSPGGNVTTVVAWNGRAVPIVGPDGSGDYLVTERDATFADTYFMRLRNGTLSTIATAAALTVDGFALDPRTGHLFARGFTPQLAFGYYNVDLQESSVTTVTLPVFNVRNFGIGARAPIFRAAGGYFVDLYAKGTQLVGSVERVDSTGLRTMTSFGAGTYPSDLLLADQRRDPVAFRALVYVPRAGTSRIVSLRADGTSTASSPPLGFPTWHRASMVRIGSRNVVYRRTGPPNDGVVDLHFPHDIGQGYAMAFTLSGMTPGYPVGDGRRIPINPDVLTPPTLAGGLPGFITRTVGRLDGAGRATVRVTMNALGTAVRGIRLWGAAVVLDRQASRGIAHVSDPVLIELR